MKDNIHEKIIYKILLELKNTWLTEEYYKVYSWQDYSWPKDDFEKMDIVYGKSNKSDEVSNFINRYSIYLKELSILWYIYIKEDKMWYSFSFPVITNKWEIFIKNYDNSLSAKLNNYMWKYSNISKLFYFLLWVLFTLLWELIIKISQ